MSNNTGDLRVTRTRKLLRDALVDLIEERGFEAITVTALAEHAMVNRTTFYRHFDDLDDLLLHSMDDIIAELTDRLEPIPDDPESDRMRTTPRHNMRIMCQHVAENARFYRVMLQRSTFAHRLEGMIRYVSYRRLNQLTPHAEALVPSDLAFSYMAAAFVGALRWWLENGLSPPTEQFADALLVLLIYGVYRAVGMTPFHMDGRE